MTFDKIRPARIVQRIQRVNCQGEPRSFVPSVELSITVSPLAGWIVRPTTDLAVKSINTASFRESLTRT